MCCDHTGKSLRKNNWACICTHLASSRATPRTQLAISRPMTPIMSSVEHLMAIHRYSGLHSDFNRCYMHSKRTLPALVHQKKRGGDLQPSVSASKKQGMVGPHLSSMTSSEGARNKLARRRARRRATCDIGVCSAPESFRYQKIVCRKHKSKNKNTRRNTQIKNNIHKH